MRELTEDRFYEVLGRYPSCVVDYVLLAGDGPYEGEASHRRAVLSALEKLAEREGTDPFDADPSKAKAKRIGVKDLLYCPERPWKNENFGTVTYNSVASEDGRIPYWYAFLEPPHGTGPVTEGGRIVRKRYGPEDFAAVNEALFPRGTDRLTAYEWTTDWNGYFDDGHEWWGTGCFSVYDPDLDRYAVILASATD